jgi:hypothetical protein
VRLNKELRQPVWRIKGETAIPGSAIHHSQAQKKENKIRARRKYLN